MRPSYWQQQTASSILFPDLEWSRPETKLTAGKLSIIGGNVQAFAAPGTAYAAAMQAGIGSAHVVLPQALRRIVADIMTEVTYAPSNLSGSFSQQALATWLDSAAWSDGTLIAGDLGRNSETAIAFESFIRNYRRPLIITKDAVDYAINISQHVLSRENTLLVLSMAQLQKLCIAANSTTPITLSMDLVRLIDALHALTAHTSVHIIVRYGPITCVAVQGRVSTTKDPDAPEIWRVATAAKAAVWWIQNPTKPYEALTTSVIA